MKTTREGAVAHAGKGVLYLGISGLPAADDYTRNLVSGDTINHSLIVKFCQPPNKKRSI